MIRETEGHVTTEQIRLRRLVGISRLDAHRCAIDDKGKMDLERTLGASRRSRARMRVMVAFALMMAG